MMTPSPPRFENILLFRRSTGKKNMIHIRLASSGDRPEWLRLRYALWPDKANHTHKTEISFILSHPDRFAAFLAFDKDSQSTGLIETAVHDIMAWGCDLKKVGYIHGWYVQFDLRGTGISQMLMEKAQKWFRNRKVTEIYSDVGITDVDNQKRYYEMGFTECQQRLLYRKNL